MAQLPEEIFAHTARWLDPKSVKGFELASRSLRAIASAHIRSAEYGQWLLRQARHRQIFLMDTMHKRNNTPVVFKELCQYVDAMIAYLCGEPGGAVALSQAAVVRGLYPISVHDTEWRWSTYAFEWCALVERDAARAPGGPRRELLSMLRGVVPTAIGWDAGARYAASLALYSRATARSGAVIAEALRSAATLSEVATNEAVIAVAACRADISTSRAAAVAAIRSVDNEIAYLALCAIAEPPFDSGRTIPGRHQLGSLRSAARKYIGNMPAARTHIQFSDLIGVAIESYRSPTRLRNLHNCRGCEAMDMFAPRIRHTMRENFGLPHTVSAASADNYGASPLSEQ